MNTQNVVQKRVKREWDSFRKEIFSTYIRKKIFEEINIEPKCQVADIGAGNGFISEELLKRDIKLIAVDNSQIKLDILKVKFNYNKLNKNKVKFLVSSENNIPIKKNTVNKVFAYMYLHHTYSPFKVIKEMTRILQKDGKIIIADLEKHNMQFFKNDKHDRWLGFKSTKIIKWLQKVNLKNISIEQINPLGINGSHFSKNPKKTNIIVATGQK